MPGRKAQGEGSIRKRADGRWECRVTVGHDPGTGKQIRKSFYAATQKELVSRMKQVQAELDSGTYIEPQKMTVGQWFDIWQQEYIGNVKPSTKASYSDKIKKHIKPAIGAIPLQKLQTHHIQTFYNEMERSGKATKSIRDIHGVVHRCLEQAVRLNYIRSNPSGLCVLPRVTKKELQVLTDDTLVAFLDAIAGERYETIFFVDLFTGMRQGEILGLTWDCVDLDAGTILINKQLAQEKKRQGEYYLDTPKHDKIRKIKPASIVMDKLRERKAQQAADQLAAGALWSNPWGLVFTNELGRYISPKMVRKPYKRIVAALGVPDLRFHDLRHSFAVTSLQNGDDVKTLQENLGHHTAAFTLDTYGHVSDQMKQESANRMDQFIQGIKTAAN